MNKQDIQIKCNDGFELVGTLYKPISIKGAIIIAPATGIKRRFYNSFATYLTNNDYGVISFDNRGIGDSRKGSINKINASLINWGKLDMSAALEELKKRFPNQSYHLIGHSAGGQLVGLMDNSLDLKSMLNFASSSGSLRNMIYPYKLIASFFLNIFIPISNSMFGKTNSQWVGMGESLPKLVAKQWKKWCNGKGYVETDFGKEINTHIYNKLEFPSLWLHAKDDGIANYENVKDMTRVYSKSKVEIITIDPLELGEKSLGHMGYFSSKNKKLWTYSLNWLNKNN